MQSSVALETWLRILQILFFLNCFSLEFSFSSTFLSATEDARSSQSGAWRLNFFSQLSHGGQGSTVVFKSGHLASQSLKDLPRSLKNASHFQNCSIFLYYTTLHVIRMNPWYKILFKVGMDFVGKVWTGLQSISASEPTIGLRCPDTGSCRRKQQSS